MIILKDLLSSISEKSNAHRCIPFWSLNDRLDPEVLRSQIRQMNEAGIGGFFMHARGGLETEYMGEDWMNCISACIDEAEKQNMEAWAYDENGWPSGFADGVVTARGWEYWQKWLSLGTVAEDGQKVKPFMPPPPPGAPARPEPEAFDCEHPLGWYRQEKDGYIRLAEPEAGATVIYIDYNRYYIDILSEKVVAYFLEVTHDKYFAANGDQAGKAWKGFFTDEPQTCGRGFAWSNDLDKSFLDAYGYDLLDRLPALLLDFPDSPKVRNDYWNLCARLFVNAWGKQIHNWCVAHNLKFTGHMMAENSLSSQLHATTGVMQFYPYFDMPGMDHLGRAISSPIQPKQVSSVAEQLGRPTLTETFALCGWDVSWEELKWIAEWQYVNGINVTCQHLAPYSLRGLRKRDYPPAMFIQQNWFKVYKHFNQYFSRLGAVLSEGSQAVDVMMLHPIKSAYVIVNADRGSLRELDEAFLYATNLLSDHHIDYHYGDEEVLKDYGCVEDGRLKVGRCSYTSFVFPKCVNIVSSTLELLEKFKAQGGRLYLLDDAPTLVDGVPSERLAALLKDAEKLCPACIREKLAGCSNISVRENGAECGAIHYMKRNLEDGSSVVFLVNHDNENAHHVAVDFGKGQLFEISLEKMTETPVAAPGGMVLEDFAPMQSHLYVIRPLPLKVALSLGDEFKVLKRDLNALTLDFCDYRIDGGEWVENTAIIILQRKLLELRKPCQVDMRLKFTVEADHLTELYACIESPEQFGIALNGHALGTEDCGFFVDSAFRKINILPYVKTGVNELTMSRSFSQKQKVYDMLFGKNVHETELNKLTYDSELESVYILGDFDVYSLSGYTYGERKATFTDGPFVIRNMGESLRKGDFGEQGFRFFSGDLTVAQEITVQKKAGCRYVLSFDKPWAPVFRLICNGEEVGVIGWAPYEIDLTDYLKDGVNEIAFELFASNRNLLGPHHHISGESYFVGPSSFSNVPGWADPPGVDIWKNSYCFVRFGIR